MNINITKNTLTIIPENNVELYAMECWAKANVETDAYLTIYLNNALNVEIAVGYQEGE